MIQILLFMVLLGGSGCVFESKSARASPDVPTAATPRKKTRRTRKKSRPQGLGRVKHGKAKALNRRRPDVALSSAPLPKELAYVRNLLAQRAFRAILTLTNQRLAKAPTNSNLHAARIVGCRHYGDYLCIDQSYDEALATPVFDLLREVARADALRHQGDPLAAAGTRRALVVEHARPHREVTTLSEIVYDFLAADDRNSAADVAWEAVALDPSSPDAWAMVARVSAADGDFEAAESYLWTADRLGRSTLVLELVRSEVLVAMGDPHDAVTAARRAAGAGAGARASRHRPAPSSGTRRCTTRGRSTSASSATRRRTRSTRPTRVAWRSAH